MSITILTEEHTLVKVSVLYDFQACLIMGRARVRGRAFSASADTAAGDCTSPRQLQHSENSTQPGESVWVVSL
jgi:hypothetical protein